PSSPYISPEKSSTPPPLGLSDSSRAAEVAACANSLASIFRVYGVTEQGQSICAHVHSFFPYFYCRVPSSIGRRLIQEDPQHYGEGTNAITAQFQAFLDDWILKSQSTAKNFEKRCLDVRIERK
ncbi:dna polymerase delta catalytic, partial [Cystoisospora suis]